MDPTAPVPQNLQGVPWVHLYWLIGIFVSGIVGMFVWHRVSMKSKDRTIAAKDALLAKNVETREAALEKLRREYEGRLEEARIREEEKDAAIKSQLEAALDLAYQVQGRPPRPPVPPPGVKRAKRSIKELVTEVHEVAKTGAFRRADLMDDTQGV